MPEEVVSVRLSEQDQRLLAEVMRGGGYINAQFALIAALRWFHALAENGLLPRVRRLGEKEIPEGVVYVSGPQTAAEPGIVFKLEPGSQKMSPPNLTRLGRLRADIVEFLLPE